MLAFFTHSAAASKRKTYIHQTKGYRLNEGHKKNGCLTCHAKSQRRGKKKGCGDCHKPRHDLPDGLTCQDCHTLESFSQIKNYRHLLNDFVRVGVHKTLACRECHPDGRFKGNRRQCVYCHMDREQDAPHGLKLGGDCGQCHTPYGWQPVRFHHPNFTLQAAHRSLNCLDCHPGYEFKNVQSFCYSCHKAEFNGQGGLDHAAAGLPYDCRLCHTINSFAAPLSYQDHPSGLISLGRHKSAACLNCHKQGLFHGLSEECQTCHQKDYANTNNPNHLTSGFPSDCELCHQPTDLSWEMGSKNHAWPLRGTHKTLSCLDCHRDGIYTGKSSECFSCHQSDYESAPNHQVYPHTCDKCHKDSDTSWHQATHPFPLLGGHADLECTDCHHDPANPAIFVCTDCHTRGATSRLHRGVSGYNYDSQSCYNCHPRGQR